MRQSSVALSRLQNCEFSDKYISYGVAHTKEELELAFKLVWQEYTNVGLHPSDGIGARVTKYNLLPDSKVFVAYCWKKRDLAGKTCLEKKVIGTLTVYHDGCLGLPSEEVCKNQIVDLRRQGARITEFAGFACDKEGLDNRVSLKLFRLAYEYCRRNNMSGVLASLTKRHIGYYRRFMGFQPLGEFLDYKYGNGTPVQGHYIDINEGNSAKFEKRTDVLFNDPNWLDFWESELDEVLNDASRLRPWPLEQMQYFISRCPALLDQLDIRSANSLMSEYQRFDIEPNLFPRPPPNLSA